MHLSEMSEVISINVLRDGEFHSLGLLSHHSDKILVGFYDPKYIDELLSNSNINCVITNRILSEGLPQHLGVAECDDPILAFYTIHDHLCTTTDFYWKSFDSEISPSASIHQKAYVAPKNVRIGPDVTIEPNATVLERCIIGKNVIIRSGAVIGGEGFEPKDIGGKKVLIPHAGGVWLHDNVEIQANSHIVKSVYGGFTEIGDDTKVDALVHVAHNVKIGKRCEIVACSVVAGSVTVGNDVFIGPNASIAPEIRIGNGAFITLGSVVTKDITEGQHVTGNFAIDHSKFISFIKSIR